MTNLENFTCVFLVELKHYILLPKQGVEIWEEENYIRFNATELQEIIVDGINYGANVVSIDKRTGIISSSGVRAVDNSNRLVEEFIMENNVHPLVSAFLRVNPQDLFVLIPNSSITITPSKWMDISNDLQSMEYGNKSNFINDLQLSASMSVGNSLGKKFVDFVRQNQPNV